MSTIDRLNREQALKARIVAFFPQDQALIESLCRTIRLYHAAMRELYSEEEITMELHSIEEHPLCEQCGSAENP